MTWRAWRNHGHPLRQRDRERIQKAVDALGLVVERIRTAKRDLALLPEVATPRVTPFQPVTVVDVHLLLDEGHPGIVAGQVRDRSELDALGHGNKVHLLVGLNIDRHRPTPGPVDFDPDLVMPRRNVNHDLFPAT